MTLATGTTNAARDTIMARTEAMDKFEYDVLSNIIDTGFPVVSQPPQYASVGDLMLKLLYGFFP